MSSSPITVPLPVSKFQTPTGIKPLPADEQTAKAKQLVALLEKENVALDFGSYRDATAGLRIRGDATVDTLLADIKELLLWLDWAFSEIRES